jgi:starch phosphorylase
MTTIQIHIRAKLPEKLEKLRLLAGNLWWSWNKEAVNLFRRIHPQEYENSRSCPLRFLNTLPSHIWESLQNDPSFLDHLNDVYKDFTEYMNASSRLTSVSMGLIAYLSMEFGLHESIPLYSGGLGVLSGDHLKTASDLGLPLIAVGLFYEEGYFRQSINRDGMQMETYELNDPFYMPMSLMQDGQKPFLEKVEIEGHSVFFQIWKLDVGRVPLYLLDTNVPENTPENRRITARLYSGGQELRIQQEMILGIGGVRALKRLGLEPTVYHLNEGHSAFLALERFREFTKMPGWSWRMALSAIKGTQVFTVHTPVPAGNDAFAIPMLSRFLGSISQNYGIPDEEFYNLGRLPGNPTEFSMPVFAIRTSGFRNGVSQLHKRVSQHIWKSLWSQLLENEVPIEGITNGIHTPTWLCLEFKELFDFYIGKGWQNRLHESSDIWKRIHMIPDSELWNEHLLRKNRFFSTIKDTTLNSDYLTIGFARRFATYKRGDLIFRDMRRFLALLNNADRPVQLIIAGKAHPADGLGKGVIQKIVHAIQEVGLSHRVVFLEDYDMSVARHLMCGVDVWLNTPIRPMEASGTSGMKAAANGVLNLSILVGWWDEAYNSDVGWAIGDGNPPTADYERDALESRLLYELLEKEIVPLYYSGRIPTAWIAKMKNSMQELVQAFASHRMVAEYAVRAYAPRSAFYEKYLKTDVNNAREESFKAHIAAIDELYAKWNQLKVQKVQVLPDSTVSVGEPVEIAIELQSPFPPQWLEVALHPPQPACLGQGHLCSFVDSTPLILQEDIGEGEDKGLKTYTYRVKIETPNPSIRTYNLRIAPNPEMFWENLDLNLCLR